MANPIPNHGRVKLFVAEVSAPITDQYSRDTKPAKDMFLEELQHCLVSLVGVAMASTHFDT